MKNQTKFQLNKVQKKGLLAVEGNQFSKSNKTFKFYTSPNISIIETVSAKIIPGEPNQSQKIKQTPIQTKINKLKQIIRSLTQNYDIISNFDKIAKELELEIQEKIQSIIKLTPNQKLIRQLIYKSEKELEQKNKHKIQAQSPFKKLIKESKIPLKLSSFDKNSALIKAMKQIKKDFQQQVSIEMNPQDLNKQNLFENQLIHKKDILAATFTNGKINNPIGGSKKTKLGASYNLKQLYGQRQKSKSPKRRIDKKERLKTEH